MTQELLFILIVFIPIIILSIFLSIFQRRFFVRYNKVLHPKEPISVMDLKKLYKEDHSAAYKFLKSNSLEFIFSKWKLFYQKYDDAKLNKYALLIRSTIAISLLLLISGILVLLLIDLNR